MCTPVENIFTSGLFRCLTQALARITYVDDTGNSRARVLAHIIQYYTVLAN
jgi:hypothetical protein